MSSSFSRLGNYVKQTYPIYIANKPVTASTNYLNVIDKFTNKHVSTIPFANKDMINKAIEKSVECAAPMSKLTSFHRKLVLLQIAEKILKRQEEFAEAIVVEVGKPLADARAEVGRAIDTFTVAAEESVRHYGETAQLDISHRNAGFQSISKRFPVGPISMIAPFNFPLNLCAHKVAPAIAAGCPFVLKPSDRTPISAALLGDILAQTDLPEGAFSIFPTELQDAPILSRDERFKLVSFTGSPAVGWKIKEDAGRKKVVLELGGIAACIVDKTIDESKLNHIVSRILFGAFYSQGQSCISVQRVYIHQDHYARVKQLLIDGVKPLNQRRGDPMNPNTFLGPMITENDAVRLEKWVSSAVTDGAKLLFGGKRDGSIFDLTILENPPKHSDVSCKEVFGPVFYIEPFTDFKEVVERVNSTEYGLQAGVFTNDINKAYYAFNNIEVGAVVINDIPSVRVDSQAYGGIKGSGLGREGIRNTIEEYTELKLMILKDIGNI
ncbi:aldehyde dehydrogenase [Heterostelium album PN500]|uniref:NADP-dependent glyceraldehyde-3-phosphate dehydrogenase n=1 Tax=Heterostelium pallidum (strain ATCC 26659 / Pp 5 / PN500) TaxID=670386 RepID=D3BER4_HETP5|nr:aldehyde dehydrogenase [Heterostelium album PN500]EFA80395.1 aldehyde dehydrogenase [Heterostelium album PN500]|eukprot:XP_020432515.1 aldehyde dehydrogenase [Heterostelium album PN500]